MSFPRGVLAPRKNSGRVRRPLRKEPEHVSIFIYDHSIFETAGAVGVLKIGKARDVKAANSFRRSFAIEATVRLEVIFQNTPVSSNS